MWFKFAAGLTQSNERPQRTGFVIYKVRHFRIDNVSVGDLSTFEHTELVVASCI